MEEFELKNMLFKIGKKRAVMDSWLEWIVVFLALDGDSKFSTEMAATRVGGLLTDAIGKVQTSHSGLEYKRGRTPATSRYSMDQSLVKFMSVQDPITIFMMPMSKKNLYRVILK